MPDAELGKVFEETEYFQEPENYRDHDNGVQDTLDLALHRYVAIHQPKQQAHYGKRYNNSHKWHFIFSNRCMDKVNTQVTFEWSYKLVLDFFALVWLTLATVETEE